MRLNGARAVASLGATIDIPGTVDDIGVHLASHARFLYRVERRDDTWRISAFQAYCMFDELRPVVPGDVLRIGAADVAGLRASYRMLSFMLTKHGFAVDNNLPGQDRPETVEAICREVYGWAGLQP